MQKSATSLSVVFSLRYSFDKDGIFISGNNSRRSSLRLSKSCSMYRKTACNTIFSLSSSHFTLNRKSLITTQRLSVNRSVRRLVRCSVKGYHLSPFEVNVGELFTTSKKKGEHGNSFKVINDRGQLGYLQLDLVDPLWPLHINISV